MNVSQNLFFYGYNNFREWLNDDNNKEKIRQLWQH